MKAIIVGSGISGLTAGAYLAQNGYQVTIYEQYPEIGGVTGEIQKDGFTWNQGQLLIEGLGAGEQIGYVLSELNLTNSIEIMREDRTYVFPDLKIEKPNVYGGPYWRKDLLNKLFPGESKGLDDYYRDYARFYELVTLGTEAERTTGLASLYLKARLYLKLLPFLPRMKWNVQRMVEHYFSSEKLQTVFISILADFVTRPSEFQGLGLYFVNPEPAFDKRIPLEISTTGRHPSYSYIRGGVGRLIDALVDKIQTAGGTIQTGKVVNRLIVEQGRVTGVSCADDTEHKADLVLVSGGASEFLDLIGPENVPQGLAKKVEDLSRMESVFMVHLGVDYDPGIHQKAATTYYINTYDIEKGVDDVKCGKYHEGKDGLLIYINSMHSPEMAPDGHHAVTVYTIAPNSISKGTWAERKEEFAEKLLIEAEKFVPGLREHTKIRKIVTPDDYKNRTHLKHHAFGGLSPVMGQKGLPHQSHIKNLWFIGAQSESGAGMNNVIEGARRAIKLIEKTNL